MPDGSIVTMTEAGTAPRHKPTGRTSLKCVSLAKLVKAFHSIEAEMRRRNKITDGLRPSAFEAYPPAPECIRDRRMPDYGVHAALSEEDILSSGRDVDSRLATLREHKAALRKIDESTGLAAAEAFEEEAAEECRRARAGVEAASVKTVEDVMAKLAFIASEYDGFYMEPRDAEKILTQFARVVSPRANIEILPRERSNRTD